MQDGEWNEVNVIIKLISKGEYQRYESIYLDSTESTLSKSPEDKHEYGRRVNSSPLVNRLNRAENRSTFGSWQYFKCQRQAARGLNKD